uniref:Uncharacterized protein n=1 Tax=Lepeophtheirus salmonis TaxID=72036 RepID=A0A0K2URF8_LEPSM
MLFNQGQQQKDTQVGS